MLGRDEEDTCMKTVDEIVRDITLLPLEDLAYLREQLFQKMQWEVTPYVKFLSSSRLQDVQIIQTIKT